MKRIYINLPMLCCAGNRDADGVKKQHSSQLCQSWLDYQLGGTSVVSLVRRYSVTEGKQVSGWDLWQAAVAQSFWVRLAQG